MTDSDKIKLADEILKKISIAPANNKYCYGDCKFLNTICSRCIIFMRDYKDTLEWGEENQYKRCQRCKDLIGGIE